MELAEILEGVHKLSTEELETVRIAIDKELSEKRIKEIEAALKEAKKAASENKIKYYSSGEDFLSALNED